MNLTVKEQLRYFILPLVPGELPNSHFYRVLIYIRVRAPLTLNYNQGNAVNEKHDIRYAVLLVTHSFHLELRCTLIGVIIRILPVDVIDVKTLGVTFNGLGQTDTKA